MLRLTILASVALSVPAAASMPVPKNATAAPPPMIKKVTTMIAKRAIDPTSVQVRSVHVIPAQIKGRSVQLVCGEFNAKNRFGGYTGFRGFVYEANDLKGVLTLNLATRDMSFYAEPGGVDFSGDPRADIMSGVDPKFLQWQIDRYIDFAQSYFPICIGADS